MLRPASLSASLCLAASAMANPAVFTWFEYSGEDRTLTRDLAPGEYHNPILTG
jgi:hypothetical protein